MNQLKDACGIARKIDQLINDLIEELDDHECNDDELEEMVSELNGDNSDLSDALELIIKELKFDINNGKLALEIAQEALIKAGGK